MVKVTVQGREFDAKNLHDIDVMEFFPDGSGHVNGVIECLSHVFDDDEFSALLDKMTVEEILEVWEEWSKRSNFEFVYQRAVEALRDQPGTTKYRRAAKWLIGSWFVTGVVAIVSLTLLLTR